MQDIPKNHRDIALFITVYYLHHHSRQQGQRGQQDVPRNIPTAVLNVFISAVICIIVITLGSGGTVVSVDTLDTGSDASDGAFLATDVL